MLKKLGASKTTILATGVTAFAFVLAPVSSVVLGGFLIVVIEAFTRITQNVTSVVLNKYIESKYRATVLSTYNMVKNLPYVLSAFLLGYLMDLVAARNFAFGLGFMLFGLLIWYLVVFDKKATVIVKTGN